MYKIVVNHQGQAPRQCSRTVPGPGVLYLSQEIAQRVADEWRCVVDAEGNCDVLPFDSYEVEELSPRDFATGPQEVESRCRHCGAETEETLLPLLPNIATLPTFWGIDVEYVAHDPGCVWLALKNLPL